MMDIVKAEIICDSVSSVSGARLTTFILEYPRIVHSEIMTHRMLSRNSASSRAIPFNKMKEQLTGRPVRFGEANPGMQDKGKDYNATVKIVDYKGNYPEDHTPIIRHWLPQHAWEMAKRDALRWSEAFYDAGYHKQCYNRLTEPFQQIRVIASATDWQNFFWLRNDKAADPTLQALAKKMEEAYNSSVPFTLIPGQWHLPLVDKFRWFTNDVPGDLGYCITKDDNPNPVPISTEEAIKVSAARCAAVSYRNEDYGLEKCLQLYDRLVGDERKHSSSLEHQAKVMRYSEEPSFEITDSSVHVFGAHNIPTKPETWEEGITHVDRKGVLWSGNFRGFIQHRQLIEGQNKESY